MQITKYQEECHVDCRTFKKGAVDEITVDLNTAAYGTQLKFLVVHAFTKHEIYLPGEQGHG